MITTKAVLAVTLMTAGSVTGASVAYLQMHPRALTGETARVVAIPETIVRPPAPVSALPDEEPSRVVMLDPVTVYGTIHHRATAVATEPSPAAPCSDWTSLATGPEGRRVRLLCTNGSR
jgi:hypothetical protein